MVVFTPGISQECSETFVKPGIGPVPGSEHIAVPLVGDLVGHQPIAGMVWTSAVGVHSSGTLVNQGNILHPTPHKIVDNDLVQFLIRVRNTGLFIEESHYFRCPIKGA